MITNTDSEKTRTVVYRADGDGDQGKLSKEEFSSPPSVRGEDLGAEPSDIDDPDLYPDGGRGWLVILGCFMFSTITVGWGLVSIADIIAWGVFQAYYKEHNMLHTSDTVLSFIGGVPGLGTSIFGVIFGKLADRYGYKPYLVAGAVFWVSGMIGAAFSTKLWHSFITQGVIPGFSCALVYPLIVALPAQWFYKKRAFTIGIVVAGNSLGGAIGSLILGVILPTLGLRKSMAIYACMDAMMLTLALFLIKERQRPGVSPKKILWYDKAFLRDPVFWSLGLSLMLCQLGYTAPIFFLPTFTSEMVPDISDLMAALPVTILNLSAALGPTIIGFVADRTGAVNALFVVSLTSGLSQLLVWNFVTTYGGIMAFATLYGFLSGSFLSLTTAATARLYGPGRLAGLSGLLLLFTIPGAAPIAGAVLRSTGNSWHVVACMNGGLQVGSALILLYARFKREPKVIAIY